MSEGRYELEVSGPAARALRDKLSETIAAAVIEFITGTLLDDPYRVGEALIGDLAGRHSARRTGWSTGWTNVGVRSWC